MDERFLRLGVRVSTIVLDFPIFPFLYSPLHQGQANIPATPSVLLLCRLMAPPVSSTSPEVSSQTPRLSRYTPAVVAYQEKFGKTGSSYTAAVYSSTSCLSSSVTATVPIVLINCSAIAGTSYYGKAGEIFATTPTTSIGGVTFIFALTCSTPWLHRPQSTAVRTAAAEAQVLAERYKSKTQTVLTN